MHPLVARIRQMLDEFAPTGSSARKMMELLSIILFFEGVFTVILFSYVGALLGIISIAVSLVLMSLLGFGREFSATRDAPFGVRLVERLIAAVGGRTAFCAIGVALVTSVLLYNMRYSPRPEIGDLDTLSVLLGLTIIANGFFGGKYRFETSFALIFMGSVVLVLVLPQVVMSISEEDISSSASNWYVNYMLAAPFSAILNVIGIPSESIGNIVSVQFEDGSVHALEISAYCAGLYSFSIFLSAFFAFVLVFERLRNSQYALVLFLGSFAAYLGNLLRMVIIGIVGYYNGIEALRWAHENVGWLIFLAWSSVFWWITLRYIDRNVKTT